MLKFVTRVVTKRPRTSTVKVRTAVYRLCPAGEFFLKSGENRYRKNPDRQTPDRKILTKTRQGQDTDSAVCRHLGVTRILDPYLIIWWVNEVFLRKPSTSLNASLSLSSACLSSISFSLTETFEV